MLLGHRSCAKFSPDRSKDISCPLCGNHLVSSISFEVMPWMCFFVFKLQSRIPCMLFTHIFGTDTAFFTHVIICLFVSFASSAQGKLLSWQHLSFGL